MTSTPTNLRKAALLIRSLDADSAATLLAQLSAEEAARVREAIRGLGPLDPEEQAELVAELRQGRRVSSQANDNGVELSLSKPADSTLDDARIERAPSIAAGKRFEFLEQAPTAVLVAHLSREHAQTVAVVLSQLAPAHAAEVLAALPEKLQSDTVQRLSVLGETDSESIRVLEGELAQWAAKRTAGRDGREHRASAMSAILAAADAKTRSALSTRLGTHILPSADRQRPQASRQSFAPAIADRVELRRASTLKTAVRNGVSSAPSPQPPAASVPPLRQIDFDHLIHLDDQTLATVIREVDPNALALALAGSGDELVDRICAQMPKPIAKSFRKELRRMGPTRLSDVEAAQRLVTNQVALQLARRRPRYTGATSRTV
jgi:flagellar motor switch protein FliG